MKRERLIGAGFLAAVVAAFACSSDSDRNSRKSGVAVCGDGEVQTGEVCDDGNTEGGDGCSADCASDESCGNGIIDRAAGERCDDGNARSGDGCSGDCRSDETCGNGYVDSNEDCDSGAASDTVDCDSDCTFAVCGDGRVNTMAGEVCDDGGESATCTSTCTSTTCGDGIVNVSAGEECDTAGESLECDLDCTLVVCGDLVVNLSAGEECDDGNADDADGCLATCKLNVCGDGFVNPDVEACDDGNVVTELACPYGVPTCLACDATCETLLELIGPWCGDGIVSDGEACDARSGGACGACTPTCDAATLARATGSIVAPPGSAIDDGDSVTISDGIRPPVTFELDEDGAVSAGAVGVRFSSSSSAAAVARSLGSAINGAPLDVRANVGGDRISLEHALPGTLGNQPISADGAFSVSGMSGGMGYDCPSGSGCSQDADCDPRLICGTSGVCEPP